MRIVLVCMQDVNANAEVDVVSGDVAGGVEPWYPRFAYPGLAACTTALAHSMSRCSPRASDQASLAASRDDCRIMAYSLSCSVTVVIV
jgi:hypothetical protein